MKANINGRIATIELNLTPEGFNRLKGDHGMKMLTETTGMKGIWTSQKKHFTDHGMILTVAARTPEELDKATDMLMQVLTPFVDPGHREKLPKIVSDFTEAVGVSMKGSDGSSLFCI